MKIRPPYRLVEDDGQIRILHGQSTMALYPAERKNDAVRAMALMEGAYMAGFEAARRVIQAAIGLAEERLRG